MRPLECEGCCANVKTSRPLSRGLWADLEEMSISPGLGPPRFPSLLCRLSLGGFWGPQVK